MPVGGSDSIVRIQIGRKGFVDEHTGKERLVLDQLDFSLRPSEFVAILGPSGCGKSTLLHLVAGLDRDFSGDIEWMGLTQGHPPRLGYVFQNPRLLPWLTLRDNIALVLDDPARTTGRIDDLLAVMGLSAFAHIHANRLSVGMQRRAALARAFAIEPALLLMDEPFVSLDAPTAEQLRSLLLKVWEAHQPTVIFVTHDLREATLLADRILFLSSPPARIISTAEVGIPRDQRWRDRLVEVRYMDLRALFQSLYASNPEEILQDRFTNTGMHHVHIQ